MTENFRCPFHERTVEDDGCVECIEKIQGAPPNVAMTLDERIEELRLWMDNVLTIPFSILWPRLDELVGRATYNHEWADPDRIILEMQGIEEYDGPIESLRRVAGPDKPIIVIRPQREEEE